MLTLGLIMFAFRVIRMRASPLRQAHGYLFGLHNIIFRFPQIELIISFGIFPFNI